MAYLLVLRGHLGVLDTVSEPLIVPLKGIPSTWLQKLNASTGIGIVHLGPPDIPLKSFLICILVIYTNIIQFKINIDL